MQSENAAAMATESAKQEDRKAANALVSDCMQRAAECAIDRGHVPMLRYLLNVNVEMPSVGAGHSIESLQVRAARIGQIGVVAYFHDYAATPPRRSAFGVRCQCCAAVATAAIANGRLDVLRWMVDAYCSALGDSVDRLGDAIASGQADVARWLARVLNFDGSQKKLHDAHVERAIARGHVETVALAHDSGLCTITVSHLVSAVRHESFGVLDWAMRASRRPPDQRPVDAWRPSALAWAAAKHNSIGSIRWLLSKPEGRRAMTTAVARTAVKKRRFGIMHLLQAEGVAPFDQWDALAAAVSSGDTKCVKIVAHYGAHHAPHVLIKAIKSGKLDIVSFLCRHYGHDHVQQAVDATAHRAYIMYIFDWLHASVPTLCVAAIQGAALARGGTLSKRLAEPCRCALRCRRRFVTEFFAPASLSSIATPIAPS